MPAMTEPKLIAGNANVPLARAVARRMSLVWGIRSLIDREVTDHDTVPIMAEEAVRRLGIGDEQDSIVVVCGFPFGVPGTTNSIRVTPLGRKDIP